MQELGEEANIIWAGAVFRHENQLRAVRTPIFRGLMSYWQIFVRKADIDRFSSIKTIDHLRQFSVLRGNRFQATEAFENAGFDNRFGDHENLTNRLASHRVDTMLMPALLGKSLNQYDAEKLGIVPLTDVMSHIPQTTIFTLRKRAQTSFIMLFRQGLPPL